MFCSKCGHELNTETIYCPKCGTFNQLASDGTATPIVTSSRPKRTMKAWVAVIAGFICSLVAFFSMLVAVLEGWDSVEGPRALFISIAAIIASFILSSFDKQARGFATATRALAIISLIPLLLILFANF